MTYEQQRDALQDVYNRLVALDAHPGFRLDTSSASTMEATIGEARRALATALGILDAHCDAPGSLAL